MDLITHQNFMSSICRFSHEMSPIIVFLINTFLLSWFRHSNGRLSPVSNNIRISVSDQVLIIRRAQLSDSGIWTCRAHNQYGEQRRDARLSVRSRLVASVHPQLQVRNAELNHTKQEWVDWSSSEKGRPFSGVMLGYDRGPTFSDIVVNTVFL